MDCLTRDDLRAIVTAWHTTHALRRLYPDMVHFIEAARIGRGADQRTPTTALAQPQSIRADHDEMLLIVREQFGADRVANVEAQP